MTIATYTASDLIQIFTGLGILITTTGGVIVSILNRGKLVSVEAKVNGHATAQKDEIKELRSQVALLVASAAENKQVAALLAQAAAKIVADSGGTPP